LIDLVVPTGSGAVVALFFYTDRAPFLVKNPAFGQSQGGAVQFEVPWRENTSVRTATRTDLIRLLTPIQKLPNFEILSGKLKAVPTQDPKTNRRTGIAWVLELEVYVTPKLDDRVVIPFHKCDGSLSITDCLAKTALDEIKLGPKVSLSIGQGGLKTHKQSRTIEATSHEVIMDGPGLFQISAKARTPLTSEISGAAFIEVRLGIAGGEFAAPLIAKLNHCGTTHGQDTWKFPAT
jgi:hypothetical protein